MGLFSEEDFDKAYAESSASTTTTVAEPVPPSGGAGRHAGLKKGAAGLRSWALRNLLAIVAGLATVFIFYWIAKLVGWIFWQPGRVLLHNGPHATSFWRQLWSFVAFVAALYSGVMVARWVHRLGRAKAAEDEVKITSSRKALNRQIGVSAGLALVIGLFWMVPRHTVADDQRSLASAKHFGSSQVSLIQSDYNTATGAVKAKVGKFLDEAKGDNNRLQSLKVSGFQPWILKEADGIKDALLGLRIKADKAVGKGKA